MSEAVKPWLPADAVAARTESGICDISKINHPQEVLEWIKPDTAEGLEVIRHSTAHLLAQAVQRLYPKARLALGPVIEEGFYYDFALDETFSSEDLAKIEAVMRDLADQNQNIERLEGSREHWKDFFALRGEDYKVEVLEHLPDAESYSVYRQGDFFDLCRGPHVPHTGHLQAFRLLKCSAAHWRGQSNGAMLQRIYGTAWASKEDLEQYLTCLQERERRNHQHLAAAMDLFHTQPEAPGMIFWHAPGWTMYRALQNFIEQFYEGRYQQVRTPQLASRQLWEHSGHWEMFYKNMFITESEKQTFAVKPMNCPCHVQIFKQSLRSHRDLPLRLAEFGCCHRNEPSGTLSGLMRVRQFVQDDGHIFCTPEQIAEEVRVFIKEALLAYRLLGFEQLELKLSTRPEARVGDERLWDQAEAELQAALEATGLPWSVQPGEGAFYGPKVEFLLGDCLKRFWQCGTIQVDFSMPERLGAQYVASHGGKCVPVMLHRAILGSLERFLGIMLEHHAGDLPLWMMPTQVVVTGITDAQNVYVAQAKEWLWERGIRVHQDMRSEKISYKIREHVLAKVPYVLIAGAREVEEGTWSVRHRGQNQTMTLEAWYQQHAGACAVPKKAKTTKE